MANQRDFLAPVAAYEDKDAPSRMFVKWGGALWVTELKHSPLDVVAWHGNYYPYKYDLRRDRKSTRLNSSHANISYAVFCLKKNNIHKQLVNSHAQFPTDVLFIPKPSAIYFL